MPTASDTTTTNNNDNNNLSKIHHYTPASSLSSQKDIESSSYTTTPSRTPGDQTPPLSGQSSYVPVTAGQQQHASATASDSNYLYVPASSRSARRDIEASSYTTTPSRTPGEETPSLSGQSSMAVSASASATVARGASTSRTNIAGGYYEVSNHQDHYGPGRDWDLQTAVIDAALKGLQGGDGDMS